MKSLLVIGCGNLMSALLLAQKRSNVKTENVSYSYTLTNRTLEKASHLKTRLDSLGAKNQYKVSEVSELNNQSFNSAHDLIVLGLKPTQLSELLAAHPNIAQFKGEILSTLAGASLESLKNCFPKASIISRIMPSIVASEIHATSLFISTSKLASTQSLAATWYKSFGSLFEVQTEQELDELTLIFGSNAAYISALINPWIKYLSKYLPIEEAKGVMITQWQQALTFLKDKDLSEVIEKVKTPKGITAAALYELDQSAHEEMILRAITLSANRAKEVRDLVSHALNSSSPDHK